jgi:polysaccharide export outer membrane protein
VSFDLRNSHLITSIRILRVEHFALLALLAVLGQFGCRATFPYPHHPPALDTVVPSADTPRELSKVVLPVYTIEPPDILVIEAIHLVPRSPYLLRTGDVVAVNVTRTLPDAPISGAFAIQPGGNVHFGLPYGAVKISGMTIEQAQAEIQKFLAKDLLAPFSVSASLLEMAGRQQIAGQHLVGPDGRVTLGTYGSVPVVGLTIADAKRAIEQHLAQFLENPEVAVDLFALNSKVYYVVTEGGGLGDTVSRFPVTGNETVLDAISNVSGLTEVSSKKIWIARPVHGVEEIQLLPVDWRGITALGQSATNYQVLPGDRVFIAEDKLVAFDSKLAKILAPAERAMGFTLLGTGTVTRLSGRVLRGGGNPNNGGGFSGP